MRIIFVFYLVFSMASKTFAQIKVYAVAHSSLLLNYANEVDSRAPMIMSHHLNKSFGFKVGLEVKKISIETGWLRTYNANRFILNNTTFGDRFKLPDVKVTFYYSEIPVHAVLAIHQTKKIKLQSVLGLAYIVNNQKGGNFDFFSSDGTKTFIYGGKEYAMDYHLYDGSSRYFGLLIHSGFRANYSIGKYLSIDVTLLFKTGFRPISTSYIWYDVYQKGVTPTFHTKYYREIINNGNSVGIELGIRFRINGLHQDLKNKNL